MASFQAHAISFVLRHTFKRQLSRSKDAEQARAVMNGGRFKMPSDVRITPATVGGVAGEWVESVAGSAAPTLVYLHGGGYFACSARTHRPYTTFFARHGFRVFAPNYRLAPENPFPAAVDDAVSVWRAIRAEANAPMVIAGDSAGGGLSLATMLRLRDEGEALPAAAALFSPLTDLVGTGQSRHTNTKRCAMFYGADLGRATQFYMGDTDPHHPWASPLFAELQGLPPLLIHVGTHETLLDDSTQLAARARAAGVPVEIVIWPVVPHVWQMFYQFVPEGRKSLAAAAGFLQEAVGSQSNAPAPRFAQKEA